MAASTKDLSAQQTQYGPVRLLIAERSENAAHQFDSLLRDAGIATRLEVIDLPMAVDKLAHADLMLCNAAIPELQQYLPRLASLAPRVPIIVVSNDEASMTQAEGMELGAADVVADADDRHLVLVVKRELDHVCQNIQLKQTRKALAEAERRCELLLSSSRASIAYVHEGMHIYANEHYLKLFGFEDADELLGLPLIDLIAGDSVSLLKEKLKAFRQKEEEVDFDFTGRSTEGSVVRGNMTLAAAEYEGEHCIQVTVRPESQSGAARAESTLSLVSSAPAARGPDEDTPAVEDADTPGQDFAAGNTSSADEASLDALADDEDNVPLLEDEADTTDTLRQNGSAAHDDTGVEAAEPSSDFELEFETSEDPAEAPVQQPPAQKATAQRANGAGPEKQAAATAGEASNPDRAAAMPLTEFLQVSERLVAERGGEFVSVFVAQVDGYEDLQRAFGLAGVDDACRQVERQLLGVVSGPFMQISPSQWGMLVCDKTREDALKQVDGYRAAIEGMMFEVREKTVRPTCTFGGAILNGEGFDSVAGALEATLDNAFSTLRSALVSGDGNAVMLPNFDNANQEFDDEANRILVLITEAIENQSFTLLFQPIISLRGDSDEHYEVFLRMNDREGKQMAPGEFLRTAIDAGVAGKIDRWVILQSIKMLSAHRGNGHNTRLTINLTSNSVTDPEFIQWLGVAIKAARLPSDAVIFQITEADAALYVRQTREFVEGLKNLHCRTSLSRFGLAAEPFEVLGHIPVDFVKLDGTLIDALDKDPDLKGVVTEMIRDLQNAGKLTVVPMVESASLLSTLWQAGVNYIQGHYLQEPSTNMDYDFSTDD